MAQDFIELIQSLESLVDRLNDISFPKETLTELEPYTAPFLASSDLISIPIRMLGVIHQHDKYQLDEEGKEKLQNIVDVINRSEKVLERINHSSYNYALPAVHAYLASMFYVDGILNQLFSIELLSDQNLLPSPIARKLSSYHERIKEIAAETDEVERKIHVINDAYNAAESLPITLEQLKKSHSKIEKLEKVIEEKDGQIERIKAKAVEYEIEIKQVKENFNKYLQETEQEVNASLKKYTDQSEKYMEQCEQAFRMTTTKGLAWSFQEKADKLNNSIRLWVVALVISLIITGVVGYYRYATIDELFLRESVSGFQILSQIMISIFGLGAPLWFSWLATKQISQRFKLAEDYEFKSSISKAYEGYRREALQLEEDFSQRLFANALTRLEEPPSRFMSNDYHSSPMSEVLSSQVLIQTMKKGGEGVDAFLEKSGLTRKINKVNKAKKTEKTEEDAQEL